MSGSPILARLSRRAAGVERREALLDVVAVALEVLGGEPFEQGSIVGVDRPLSGEDLGDRPRLVAGPGSEGGDQDVLSTSPFCRASRPMSRSRFAASRGSMCGLRPVASPCRASAFRKIQAGIGASLGQGGIVTEGW